MARRRSIDRGGVDRPGVDGTIAGRSPAGRSPLVPGAPGAASGASGAGRTWVDPRLVVGAVLVVASIVGVWLVVEAAGRSTTVWVADETLLPGDVIRDGDVARAELRLGDADDRYLLGGTAPTGLVVARTIGEGEAVPIAAVGDATSIDVATVVLAVQGGLASSIEPGSAVDVWSASLGEQGRAEPASVLVADAVVVGVVEDEGIIATDDVRLEVLVPRADVAAVLDAIAGEHAVSVVPVAVPVASP